jgi:ankyrin repeat protein
MYRSRSDSAASSCSDDIEFDQGLADIDLYLACERADLDAVKEALRYSKAVDFVDLSSNKSCLMAAATRGHSEICLHLLKAGAEKDRNLGEGTALQQAHDNNHKETVKQLILAGCTVPFTLRIEYRTTIFARSIHLPPLIAIPGTGI